jgi:hypothetical protein
MTPVELYKLLDGAGVDYEIVEMFDGARILNIAIDEPEWQAVYCGAGQYAIFSDGREWVDKKGNFLSFSTLDEANQYIQKTINQGVTE